MSRTPVPHVLFVDLQYDFTRPGGICYAPRHSPAFVRDALIPYLKSEGIASSEIVSDYRQPRPGDPRDCCRPGEWGFTSEVPEDLVGGRTWTKCMNSPLWTREGIGDPSSLPGVPYQDPRRFGEWLAQSIGDPPGTVVLAGLTLDACILCTAQELTFRNYDVRILREGTDTRSGDPGERDRLIDAPPISFWSRSIQFSNMKELYEGRE